VLAWRLARRIDRETAFTGIGSFRFGGRWNSAGRYAVYVSASLATAALEIMVHAGVAAAIPNDEIAIRVVIPDKLRVQYVDLSDLPPDWQEPNHPACTALGDRWLASKRTAVLSVPSAVVPLERNLVLNPQHDDFAQINVSDPGIPFRWDPRLISFLVA